MVQNCNYSEVIVWLDDPAALVGLRGSALVAGAVGSNAMRPLPADIEAYLQSLMP